MRRRREQRKLEKNNPSSLSEFPNRVSLSLVASYLQSNLDLVDCSQDIRRLPTFLFPLIFPCTIICWDEYLHSCIIWPMSSFGSLSSSNSSEKHYFPLFSLCLDYIRRCYGFIAALLFVRMEAIKLLF